MMLADDFSVHSVNDMNTAIATATSKKAPLREKRKLYDAFVTNGREIDGVVFVGVKTTGIFCRPGCPARKPKFENCDFFRSAQDALLSGLGSMISRSIDWCRQLSQASPAEVAVVISVPGCSRCNPC